MPPYTAQAVCDNGQLKDIMVSVKGRDMPMLGPAGPQRELSILPPMEALSAPGPGQSSIPVLLGAGTGAALQHLAKLLEKEHGRHFLLVVVDKELPLLELSGTKECLPPYKNVFWIHAENPEEAVRELTRLQYEHGGKPFLPVLNPFYLRLDRDYYTTISKACEASLKANFWAKAQYAKFAREQPRLLLLTSQYFLIGEIIAACKRLGVPHRLLQVPEGELGQGEFIELLLSAVLEFKPDFVFTINHLGVDREGVLIDLLERLRLPLASWFVDNPHLILYLYSRLVSPWTSIFTWDADNISSLHQLGFTHVSYLPLGVDVTRFRPAGVTKGCPLPGIPKAWNKQISFVGNSMLYKVRQRLGRSLVPDALREAYPALAAGFASGEERSVRAYLGKEHPELLPAFNAMATDEDRLNYETLLTWEATLQYRLACIQGILPFSPLIAGDTGWQSLLAKTPGWHYRSELNYYDDLPRFYPCAAVNFNCTSKQMKGAVNQRVFDVPATESFLLTDYREQVENLFEPGREIICYHHPEEAAQLARDYLSLPRERLKTAKAARKRILSEHSYDHRLKTLMDAMRRRYG